MIDPAIAVLCVSVAAGFGASGLFHLNRQRRIALDLAVHYQQRAAELQHKVLGIELQRRLAGEKGRRVQAERRAAATGTKSETFAKLQGEVAA